ncbi:MAG: hypothetical protein AAGA29_10815 [Planctomycetota bacterium]
MAFCIVALSTSVTVAAEDAPEPTPYERYLDNQRGDARELADRAGELVDGLNDREDGAGDFLSGLLSLDAMADPTERLAAIEQRRRRFLETPATPHDIEGLDHLAAGRYDAAAEAFGASVETRGGRGLPHLFAGIAHLERGDWQSAAESLSHALGDEHCEPTAGLLHAWARSCADAPPVDDATAGLRFAEAFFASGGLGEIEPAVLMSGRFRFNESSALAWAEGTLFNLRHERVAELLESYETTDDPRLAEAIAFGLTQRQVPDARLDDLARRFPDDASLTLAAEWAEYMAMEAEELQLAWMHAQALVEREAQRDPGNGAYAFMSVFPFHVIDMSVYDDYSKWDEDPDYDPGRPLTEAETAALLRAAQAPRFEYPGASLRGRAIELRESLYGGFALRLDVNPSIIQLRKIREVARRYPNTFARLVEADRFDEAVALGEAVVVVAECYGGSDSGDRLLARLVSQSVQMLVAYEWAKHAGATGDRALLQRTLELHIHNWRMTSGAADLSMAMLLAEVLPIARLRKATDALSLTLGQGEGSPGYAAYLLGMRHDTDPTVEDELEDLAWIVDRPEDERLHIGDYNQRSIVCLADRGEERALPALRKIAADEDHAFVAMLAQWAINRIENTE